MQAKNITREQLEHAAECIGVTVDVRTLNNAGTRHQVKVNPGETRDADGDRKYQRISPSQFQNGRRVAAVCWHGFRDFFRECFKAAPDAVFRTAMDTWNGSADFEARYRESGHRNVGSQMYPMTAAEACRCPESGMAV